jgi:hypothetical protein
MLLAIGCCVQVVGWRPGFPIAGAFAGMLIGIGLARKQVSTDIAAALVGAILPTTIVELSYDDGTMYMMPVLGAWSGWGVWIVFSRTLAAFRRLQKDVKCVCMNKHPMDKS